MKLLAISLTCCDLTLRLRLRWAPGTHMQRRRENSPEKHASTLTAVKNYSRDMGGNRSVLQSSSVSVVYKYEFYIILTHARIFRIHSFVPSLSLHDVPKGSEVRWRGSPWRKAVSFPTTWSNPWSTCGYIEKLLIIILLSRRSALSRCLGLPYAFVCLAHLTDPFPGLRFNFIPLSTHL